MRRALETRQERASRQQEGLEEELQHKGRARAPRMAHSAEDQVAPEGQEMAYHNRRQSRTGS